MSLAIEATIKLLLTIVSLGCLIALASNRYRWLQGKKTIVLAVLAATSLAAWFNFGAFHERGGFVHNWEQFHYVLGSKYFPELGYDGLYAAAALSIEEQGLRGRLPDLIRDQRTNELVPRFSVIEHGREVRAAFSEERWRSFGQDVKRSRVPRVMWHDHGYNPTPAWTFTGRLLSTQVPVTKRTKVLFGLVDLALLAVIFGLIWRSFGLTTACCAMIVFGLNYNARFYWTGGAFLRQDWLAAVTIGVCMLHERRFGIAGLALAYAASVRVFPVFFLFPIGIYALRQWKDGEPMGWLRPLVLGLVIGGAVMFVAGGLTGRGLGAWLESAERLQWLQAEILGNGVGARMPFITSLDTLRGTLLGSASLYDGKRVNERYQALKESRSMLIWAVTIFLSALVAWAAWRAEDPAQACILGLVLIFALLSAGCYYWVMLLLMPIRQPIRSTIAFLVVMLTTYALHPVAFALHAAGYIEKLAAPLAFALISAFMLIMFVFWLMPGRDAEKRQLSSTIARGVSQSKYDTAGKS